MSEGSKKVLCEGEEEEGGREVMRTLIKKGRGHPSRVRIEMKTWD